LPEINMTETTGRPTVDFDNVKPEVKQDLHNVLRDMQNRCPVAWSEASGGFWTLTKYDDVVAASNDWQTFTVTKGIMIPPTGATMPVIPGELDPPRHTKLRKLVMADFTERALQKWIPEMNQIIASAFEPVLARGRADLASEISHPVPVLIIALVLGIDSDWRRISRLASGFMQAIGNPELARARALELESFLEEEISARRDKPVVDLLGKFVNTTVDGEAISHREILGLVQLMVVAGHETTVNGMATVIHRLITEPGLRERLLADRSLMNGVINETLRLHTPVWNLARTVVQETEMRGVNMCPGEKVMLAYAAANRDPQEFVDPERFDIDRDGLNRHLTFGFGRHRCIGEALAKLEIRLTLEYVLDQLPDVEPDGQPEWSTGTNTFGIRSLPVKFSPRPTVVEDN
jgi:cytochrome P450